MRSGISLARGPIGPNQRRVLLKVVHADLHERARDALDRGGIRIAALLPLADLQEVLPVLHPHAGEDPRAELRGPAFAEDQQGAILQVEVHVLALLRRPEGCAAERLVGQDPDPRTITLNWLPPPR
jgi:hypothetical protein